MTRPAVYEVTLQPSPGYTLTLTAAARVTLDDHMIQMHDGCGNLLWAAPRGSVTELYRRPDSPPLPAPQQRDLPPGSSDQTPRRVNRVPDDPPETPPSPLPSYLLTRTPDTPRGSFPYPLTVTTAL